MSRRNKSAAKRPERTATAARIANRDYRPVGLTMILLAILVVYWPARNGEQLWDDDAHITKPELQSLHGLARIWFEPGASQQYYPLLHSAFWIEHKLWGDDVLGYHVVNVFLHMVAVTLLYVILRRLKIPGALLATAIFALHPVMVESVAWISEQKNTLSAVFYLGAMLAYLKFDDSRERGATTVDSTERAGPSSAPSVPSPRVSLYVLALAVGLFILGLLTKTVTATLPAALLVIFWWQRGTLSWRRDIVPLVPFFVLGAAGGLMTAHLERTLIGADGPDFNLTFIERGLLAGRVVWFYFGKLLWPVNLIFIYPRWEIDPQVWWQWIFPVAAIGVTVGLLLSRKRWRAPLAGWLLFVGTLFPVLGFLNVYPFLFSYVADHFQYLASLGMIVLTAAGIAVGLQRLPQSARGVGLGCTVLLVLALATLSFRQSRMYADRVTLYESTVARNPNSWLAHNNLGAEYERAGDHEAAMKQYRAAISLRPNCAEAHSSLGFTLAVVGRLPEAFEEHQKALELKPDHPLFLGQLSIALINAGRQTEAVEKLQAALARTPDDPIIHSTLGAALTQLGRYPEAKEHLERALQLLPEYAEAHQNLGTVLAYTGQTQQAIDEIRRSLEVNPNSVNAHSNLAFLLTGMGDMTGAITHYEAVVRLRPGNADMQNKLAVALQQAGRTTEAIAHYQAAISLQPKLLPAYGGLARTLAAVNRPTEAIATAEKAIEVARSIGLDSEATRVQEWLTQYRAELQRASKAASSQPPPPQNNRGNL